MEDSVEGSLKVCKIGATGGTNIVCAGGTDTIG